MTKQSHFRLSDQHLAILDEYMKAHNLKNKTEALEQILSRVLLSPTESTDSNSSASGPIPFESAPKALTSTFSNSPRGLGHGKPTLAERLQFERERAEIRVDTARRMEIARQQVKEAVRRIENDSVEAKTPPFLMQPCPQGHSPNHCFNNPCDRRGQCVRDGIVNREQRDAQHPAPFSFDYVS